MLVVVRGQKVFVKVYHAQCVATVSDWKVSVMSPTVS